MPGETAAWLQGFSALKGGVASGRSQPEREEILN